MVTKLKYTNTSGRLRRDRFSYFMIIGFTVITILPLILIIGKLVVKGMGQINLDFFTKTTPNTLEAMVAVSNGDRIPGGILNGITGSLYMLLIASAIAIPVGILTGVFLSENPDKRYSRIIRDLADVLQGVPSIVLGIIAYMWIVKHVTQGFSALAGSVALAIMMLPLIVRSTEETMKMIPPSIREAGFALGIPYHKIIFRILLPSGMSGLLTGILLAISRILGETAPLMMTALGSSVVNFNIDKPTSSVPLLIWEFYNDPNMISLIWGSSLFLMFIILGLNITAKRVAKKWKI